jgi:hypothetical protein
VDFFSDVAGHFDLDPTRSRALVALYDQGRVIEVDLRSGQTLWEYANIHDIGAYLRSNGKNPSQPYALFNVTSAFYVPRPAFLN